MKNNKTSLDKLIGKTIASIKTEEVTASDDCRVFYHLTFSDNTQLSLMADGGNSGQYTHIMVLEPTEVVDYKNDDWQEPTEDE
jgi:hypothetical protein